MSETLLTTNPYLRDARARKRALRVSAASSSAVEGIYKPFAKRNSKVAVSAKATPRARAKSAE